MHGIAQFGDNMYEIAQVGDNMHGIAKKLIEICRVGGRCEVEVCGWGVTVGIQTDNVTSFFCAIIAINGCINLCMRVYVYVCVFVCV